MKKDKLYVVKIGGDIVDNASALQSFLHDFSKIKEAKILVHGGGKTASSLGKKLDIPMQMVNGRRITDNATLDVICMVYAGLINKQIVCALQNLACNAIGLTGTDANLIPARRRPAGDIDFGFVGDVLTDQVNNSLFIQLLSGGMIPVIAPVTHDMKGQLLNTNADTIAASIAVALKNEYAVALNYCFEKKGVLLDSNNNDSVIPEITFEQYSELKTIGTISGGLIPKLDNAFYAKENGVTTVTISNATSFFNIPKQLKSNGTTIVS